MKRWITALGLVLSLLFVPSMAVAQAPDPEEGFIFRANGDVTVAPDEVLGGLVVANGNAIVQGEVTQTLVVISGDATVEGTVRDLVVIDGTAKLAAGSTTDNVSLFRGTLDRATGATVTGDINEQSEFSGFGLGALIFPMVMWLGVTLALIIAVIIFAIYGRRQLAAAGTTLRERFGMSALASLALWVGLPVLGVIAFVTVIGIPLGIGIFLFLLPALWLIGYLVAAAKIGEILLGMVGVADQPNRYWLVAAAGVLLMQVIGLIPAFGPFVVVVTGLLGSGALVYRLVGHWQVAKPVVPQPTVPQPVH